jgi:hypothetical protein
VLKIQEWEEIMKKVIRPLGQTMSENPKCHLHIPNLGKVYVLNIIVQGIMEKNVCEGKGSQGNTQNVNAPNRGIETRWR